jgi:uncharacterized protein YjbI with pentapeptide repeats
MIAARRNSHATVAAPDLPEFAATDTGVRPGDDGLVLDRVRLELDGAVRVPVTAMQISESDIRGLSIDPGPSLGLRLTDVALRNCDLSNLQASEGSLNRVAIGRSKLIGFGIDGGRAWDLRVTDSSLSLASFAYTGLRDVIFERVNLREASFTEARLEGVEFIDCQLEGLDLRRARLKHCSIRGSALDGVIGIEALKGVTMPWADVVASAAALADTVGINVE